MDLVHVTSEIAPLKKVMLHRPGAELLNLTPSMLEELLFDDIPYLRTAQMEHDTFAAALKDEGVEVIYLEDLVAECIGANPGLKRIFLNEFLTEGGVESKGYRDLILEYLSLTCPTDLSLVEKTMAGVSFTEIRNLKQATGSEMTLSDLMTDRYKMLLSPLPNLYFTRDAFTIIGNCISINRMLSVTRSRETIYGDVVFSNHPEYSQTPKVFSRNGAFHIEGGDILNLTPNTIAIGISQRSEPDAVQEIAKNLFECPSSSVEKVIAISIPVSRAFMHLDTVFTQIDYDRFIIHPGIISSLKLYELTPAKNGKVKVRQLDQSLGGVLASIMECPVELIECGGGDRISAEREQWSDGSNTLAVKPGRIIVYDRNDVTNDLLDKRGIDLIEIPSAELSRGRGGAHCMSMPFLRAD